MFHGLVFKEWFGGKATAQNWHSLRCVHHLPVAVAESGALHAQDPTRAVGTGPRVKASSASSSPFKEQRTAFAQCLGRAVHVCRRTAIAKIANFTFKLKNEKKVTIF